MRLPWITAAVGLACVALRGAAQYTPPAHARHEGHLPAAWTLGGYVELEEAPILDLPLADPDEHYELNRQQLGRNARNVHSISHPQGGGAFDALEAGEWSVVPDPSGEGLLHLLRLEVRSLGAFSQRLVFSDIYLPRGGQLVIHAPHATSNATVCTDSCQVWTADDLVHNNGVLTTLHFAGDRLVLEYLQQADPFEPGAEHPTLQVLRTYQGLGDRLPAAAAAAKRRRRLLARHDLPQGTSFDIKRFTAPEDKGTGSCTLAIACDSSFKQAAAAIVDIYAIDPVNNLEASCTGSVIVAPSDRKYLLTADHCFADKKQVSSFQYWVLLFNYEYNTCQNQTNPTIRQVIQGTLLVYYDQEADVLLLEIPISVPDQFRTYRLGFDASPQAVPKRAVAIHHPAGTVKRISYANATGAINTQFDAPKFPADEVRPTDKTHFEIHWTLGSTEGGSSGSPLIDMDTKRVVGILSGGFASCANRNGADYYGRLSSSWDRGLWRFLSNAPPDDDAASLASVARAIGTSNTVIVNKADGKTPEKHGPAIGYFPTGLFLTPAQPNGSFIYYLTDPPAKNESLNARFLIDGDLPGNVADATKYVELGKVNDTYQPGDPFRTSRLLPLHLKDLPDGKVPGGFMRFDVIIQLRSNTTDSYENINLLKVIVQDDVVPWQKYKVFGCKGLPCNLTDPIIPDYLADPRRATFEFTPPTNMVVAHIICFKSKVLLDATVTVYINSTFAWTLSHDPFGDPDCLNVPGLAVKGGATYSCIATDNTDFNSVLPITTVQSLRVFQVTEVNTFNRVNTPVAALGPVAAAPTPGDTAPVAAPPLAASAPTVSAASISDTSASSASAAGAPGPGGDAAAAAAPLVFTSDAAASAAKANTYHVPVSQFQSNPAQIAAGSGK